MKAIDIKNELELERSDVMVCFKNAIIDDLDIYCYEDEWYCIENVSEDLETFEILAEDIYTVRNEFDDEDIKDFKVVMWD